MRSVRENQGSSFDRLFALCLGGAIAAYAVFMIVVHLWPGAEDDEPAQAYLGVVSNESTPSEAHGLGGREQDPSDGTVLRDGPRPGWVVATGHSGRNVTLAAPEGGDGETKLRPGSHPTHFGSARARPAAEPGGFDLPIDELVFGGLEELAELGHVTLEELEAETAGGDPD